MKTKIARILRESSHAILKITTRERTSNIALNQDYLKSVDKIKGFSEADKQQVREIFSKNLEQGRGMRGSARDLEKTFPDMERKRAEMIARTGHTEIRNLAENEKYKEKGFNSFTVDSTAEACDECNETYQNYVFSMDDVDMLPPLHPHCMCVAVYHEETPEEYADLNGLEVYSGGGEIPEMDYTDYVSTDVPELQDLQETIDYVNSLTNDELSTVLEDSISSVLGSSAVDEAVISDVVGNMDSFITDPELFFEREPLKANVLIELLRRLKIIA